MHCLLRACLLLIVIASSYGTEVLRPRGVSLIKASLYDPSRDFSCLDGSAIIPFRYVNDDYCDCRDGSDEPGTSACPNGLFHCANVGHLPTDLRSSRVNDGICDCCDASDEWAGGADCTNQCQELGRAAREEAARKEEETKQGYTLKLGMIEQGKNIKREKQDKITQMELELQQAEAVRAEREAVKAAAEEPEAVALEQYKEAEEAKNEAEKQAKRAENEAEAHEAFQGLDTDGDGSVTREEIQADVAYDTNRDGTVSDDEAAFYTQHSDSLDFDSFYTKSWRLMRPAFLFAKKKVGSAPPSLFTPPSTPPPPAQKAEEEDTQQDEEAGDEHDEGEEEDDYDPELDGVDDGLDEEEEEGEVQDEAPEVVYDEETQALVDAANAARAAYQEAHRTVEDLQKQLKQERASLEKDYGPEDEFRVFEGNCYEYTDREYTYKLCPFDKATQSPKNGGGETRLGTWFDWVGEGEAAGSRYAAMKYTDGQGCWNGPNRSTFVELRCGVETELVAVSEPSKCEYVFIFVTPAACDTGEASRAAGDHDTHTEL